MKKVALFIILLTGLFLGQNRPRPGIDYLMHTGFFDHVVNALHHPRGDTINSLIANYQAKGWYFDKLRELGLTNLVTDGMYNLSITDTNNKFLLNDMGFAWKHDPSLTVPKYFKPAEFMRALGHVDSKYPLEFGGTTTSTIASGENFGFTLAGSNATCYWGMRDEYRPAYLETTGQDILDNTISGAHHSRLSEYGTHDEGVMLWGMIPWTQLADPRLKYKMRIYLRIADNDTIKEMDGIGVYAGPLTTRIQDQPQIERRRDFFTEPEEIPIESVGLAQSFKNNQLPESSDYYWIETNSFNVSQDLNLAFHIYWYGNLTVYIDKITFVSEEFERLYVNTTGPVLMDSIFTELETIYPASITDSARFQSFYFDEPFQLSAEYRKDLQAEVFSKATNNNNLEINGATGAVPGYFHHFDIKWASPTENRLKNYLLYNLYPIGATTNYTQEHVQGILNTIVNYRVYNFGDDAPYQFSGLRSAQLGAQRYNTDETDDIPLVMTLGVHSEQYVVGDDLSAYTVTGLHSRRAPTYDEIFAQGNLSLAYGAKGFMYYMVPTRAAAGTVEDPAWNTFGLFDDETAIYDSSNSGTGLVQDPAEYQITNHRFSAVRDFIASTALIDSVLLKLRWMDAKGWNRTETSTINWINSVSTALDSNFTQADATPMVETGYFEEYHTTGYNPNAKYLYVVNKRCNSNINGESSRYVAMEVNYGIFQGRSNLKFTNLKSGRIYYTKAEADVVVFLKPGDGTLFKIEPTILTGGLLVENETVSSSIEVESSLELSQYKKLRIENGADVTFKNSSRLYVYNSDLEIEGTSTDPSVINFLSPNWTLGNGLVARYADVSINNARIKNASAGIYGYRCSTFVVSNTIIDSCYFGIAMEEQGSPYGTNVLSNLTLNRCNTRGITTNDVILMAKDIVISGGENAMMFWDSEFNCFLMQDTANINISDHMTSVYSNNSDLNFGYDDGYGFTDGRYNTFRNSGDNNFYVENYSEVMAQYDYWETKSNYSDYTSKLVDEPSFEYEGDNPLIIPNDELASVKHNFTGEGGSTVEKFELAKRIYKKGNLTQAREICSDIIDNNSNDELIPAVISLLIRTFKEEGKEALGQYIANGNNATSNSTAKGLLQAATALFTEDVNTVYDDIITRYPGKYPAEYSLYKKALYQTGSQMDKKGAKITFNKLRTDFPNSLFIKDLVVRLADTMGFSNKSVTPLGLPKQQSQTSNTEVFEYNLLNNYPNPFNPETVIKFSLKEKSNVTLDVYNIAGQKVAELLSGEMEKGFYERKFDGTKLSSGVYIFRLTAQSLENGNLKYSKTMKALLLK